MIKTILLAVDLSVFTPYLLHHAADLAKQHQAKLVAVHAVEPLGNLGHALLHAYLKPETSHTLTTTGLDALIKEVKSRVIDTLTDEFMAAELESLPLTEVIVETGNPVDLILEAASISQADLIVLGSRSPDEKMNASLGSVAQKILHNAKVPVFVVPSTPMLWDQNATTSQLRLW